MYKEADPRYCNTPNLKLLSAGFIWVVFVKFENVMAPAHFRFVSRYY